MQKSIKKVLLMEASSRQVLPMARAFYKMGCEVITVCSNKSDLGNITRFKHSCYVVENIDEDFNIADKFYNDIISEKKYDIVLPLSDFSAHIAAVNKEKWSALGCYVAVNDWKVFNLAYDKLNTMRICMENDIPCPQTILFEKIGNIDFESVKYPVVIKPRSSCGSIGFHIVEDEVALRELLRDDSHGPLLIQEFIPQSGKQYNAHFVLDSKHNVKTAVCTEKCRWFPLDGGASTLCRTIDNKYILDICEKLLKKLDWIGYCDVDLMEDPRDGSIRVIEINARISANVKICFAAGADVAKQIKELSDGNEVTRFDIVQKEKRLRCIHTDLLWLLKSPNRFNTDPSWFSFCNTTDQIFSLDDILPFIIFSVTSLLKYRREMKKRKR